MNAQPTSVDSRQPFSTPDSSSPLGWPAFVRTRFRGYASSAVAQGKNSVSNRRTAAAAASCAPCCAQATSARNSQLCPASCCSFTTPPTSSPRYPRSDRQRSVSASSASRRAAVELPYAACCARANSARPRKSPGHSRWFSSCPECHNRPASGAKRSVQSGAQVLPLPMRLAHRDTTSFPPSFSPASFCKTPLPCAQHRRGTVHHCASTSTSRLNAAARP